VGRRELLVKRPSVGHNPKGLWIISKGKVSLRGAFFVFDNMPKNLTRYYQAWKLRQQEKTFREIGEIMGIHKSRVNYLIHFMGYKIKYFKNTS